MGTSKKIVLASIVSMLMVLGFLVGLVPSGARTEAGTADRVDMVDLLDLIMGVKGVGSVTLSSPVEGVLVKTPDDNFVTPNIPVPVQANVTGDGSELVTFVANDAESTTAFPGGKTWVGDDANVSEAVASPFVSSLDIGSFITGVAGTTTNVAVYALVNATAANSKAATSLVYETANEPADFLPLFITETDGNVDGDNNGLPDNPFDGTDGINPGEVWISDQQIGGQLRTVLVANLDSGAKGNALGTIFTSPTGNVTVESPDLTAFQNAGAIGAGESGFLLVSVVNDLAGAVDQINGGGTVGAWADSVEALQPGALLAGAQYVEISLVYSLYSGTVFDELDTLPGGLNINLTMTGLTQAANTTVGLYSYPTNVVDQGGNIVVSGDATLGTWDEVSGATFASGAINASLSSLSVFAPIGVQNLPPVSIAGAAPNQIAEDVATQVTITGVFPTTVALNAAAAAAAYTVTVGGTAVSFAEVSGTAITAFTSGNNELYINVPAIDTPGFYDVTVTDNADSGNTATAAGLIEVRATSSLATEVLGGTGTITVNPTSSAGLPAGVYYTGTAVSASVVYDQKATQVRFDRWLRNGVPAGTDPASVTILVGDNANDDALTTLSAQLVTETENAFALTVNAGTGGTATAVTPPNGTFPGNVGKYIDGTTVTISATANSGFTFSGWTGATVADANAASTTLVITADTTVTANFTPNAYTVTVDANSVNGTVTILTAPNHPNGTSYLVGTAITIQATPNDGYLFDGWTGADAGDLADSSAATTSFVIDGSQPGYSFTANFIEPVSGCPTVTSVSPAEAWIFGGIVARINGTNLTDDTIITIGGIQVQGFRAFQNGKSVDVVIPASTDTSDAATIAVDVTVECDDSTVFTLPNGFTYKRYQTEDGVNTTAFIIDNPSIGADVEVTLNGANNAFAELEIPALEVPSGVGTVYGIARNAIVGDTDDKGNTAAIGALGTNSIGAGAQITGVSDFSLHLYATDESAKANTPTVGSGTLSSASGLVNFGAGVGGGTNPVDSTPVLLTFPITGSGLTYGDVKNSLTLWGVQTEYDYVTEVTTLSDPENVEYQSEILNNEVDLPLTPGTSDAAEPNLIAKARIYSLNGFSLRQDALVPSEVADGIRLANASGTANGDVAGGTALRIVSPAGGLAHIDRIVFTQAVAAKAVGGTVATQNIVTPSGTTEYEVQFTTPKSANAGIANIVIYGKADPNTPIVQLDRVYEYTKQPKNLTPLALLLLGLLVAGLGLAAGGDSGGGGGGPCFIATAAYGTPMAAQIDTLRDFRDTYLLSNTVGTALTDVYYRVSPPIADAVAQSPVLAAAVRVMLVPVIFLGKVAMAMPFLTAFVGLSLGAAYALKRRRAGRAN